MNRQRTGGVSKSRGRYRARIRIDGVPMSRTFDTEREAWHWLRAVQATAENRVRRETTLASACAAWLDERETEGRLRSIDSQRRVYRAHVRDWPKAKLPIARLKRKHVSAYLRELAPTRRPQTLRNILNVIRGALAWAHDNGIVRENVAAGMRIPKTAKEASARPEWLRQDEVNALMRYLEGEVDAARKVKDEKRRARLVREALARRAFFAVAVYCGLRKSELRHLRWSCVTLTGRRPEVRVRDSLKTAMAARDVPLLGPAREALQALRDAQEVPSIGLVWPSPSGRVRSKSYTAQWADKRWRGTDGEMRITPGAKTLAGIDRPVRFHDLRHTCASHLVQGTWAPPMRLEDVRQWMGHSSIKVTERYSHLSPGGLHALVEHTTGAWEQKT